MKPIYVFGLAAGVAAIYTVARRMGGDNREDDAEAIARMLITETRMRAPEAELAAIAQVAINRAKKWNAPILDVVSGPKTDSIRMGWNGSSKYTSVFDTAESRQEWKVAVAFAHRVLNGEFKKHSFITFIHPGGMPTPPCRTDGAKRIVADTIAGQRCIPEWSFKQTIGKAMFA
jgi:hypothetical protein